MTTFTCTRHSMVHVVAPVLPAPVFIDIQSAVDHLHASAVCGRVEDFGFIRVGAGWTYVAA